MEEKKNVDVVKIVTKHFYYRGKDFLIVKLSDDNYGSLDWEWIDENGKLNREVNGLMMNLGNTPERVLQQIQLDVLTHEYMEQGYTLEKAISTAHKELVKAGVYSK